MKLLGCRNQFRTRNSYANSVYNFGLEKLLRSPHVYTLRGLSLSLNFHTVIANVSKHTVAKLTKRIRTKSGHVLYKITRAKLQRQKIGQHRFPTMDTHLYTPGFTNRSRQSFPNVQKRAAARVFTRDGAVPLLAAYTKPPRSLRAPETVARRRRRSVKSCVPARSREMSRFRRGAACSAYKAALKTCALAG